MTRLLAGAGVVAVVLGIAACVFTSRPIIPNTGVDSGTNADVYDPMWTGACVPNAPTAGGGDAGFHNRENGAACVPDSHVDAGPLPEDATAGDATAGDAYAGDADGEAGDAGGPSDGGDA